MENKRITTFFYSKTGVVTILFLTIIIAALISSAFRFWRLDLTENNLYTIPPALFQFLDEIDEDITLQFYFSQKLTSGIPSVRLYKDYVSTVLIQIADKSEHITLEVLDPEPFSEEEDQAVSAGLQAVPVNLKGGEIYFGLVAKTSNGKQETIPFFHQNKQNTLAYDLAKLLFTLTQTAPPKIAIVNNHLQAPPSPYGGQQQGPMSWFAIKQLSQFFKVKTLKIEDSTDLEEYDLLVLIQPYELKEEVLYKLEQFTLSGGRLLILLDPYPEYDPSFPLPEQANQLSFSIKKLLNHWGVDIDMHSIVLDAENALLVNQGRYSMPESHPGIIGLRSFPTTTPVTSSLRLLHFSSAGAITRLEEGDSSSSKNNDLSYYPLLTTSKTSDVINRTLYQATELPKELFRSINPDKASPKTLAMKIHGTATALLPMPQNEKNTITETNKEEGSKKPYELAKSSMPDSKLIDASNSGHLAEGKINVAVIPDIDFLTDNLWINIQNFFGRSIATPFADNGNFLINLFDFFAGNTTLINMRPGAQLARPFHKVLDIKREAEERYLEKEQELKLKLQETEQQLSSMQASKQPTDTQNTQLSEEQKTAIDDFVQKKVKIRKDLREVRHNLTEDIEKLGLFLTLLNTLTIPLLITIALLLTQYFRKERVYTPKFKENVR